MAQVEHQLTSDSSSEKQQPTPDEVASMLIEQMGDRYALAVSAEIRRLATPDEDDNSASTEKEQPSDTRRGYHAPPNSAAMRGYMTAREAA